ncbi:MAG: response regulator [Arcobacteraceae bacterium]|jgi:CheY-like chemotaxis protein|nr:response regulator [Arcobacteraceae bacterium]
MKKNKVVIVDDNGNNLLLEKDLMEVAGFEVFEAINGLDGVAMVLKEKPNVIIMDIRLPDISGLEAINILRQNKEMSAIPVVFVTASVLEVEKQALIAIPNSGFISKPIDTRTFASEIALFIK